MYAIVPQSGAFQSGALGAEERSNPLPAGRYQIDVFTPNWAAFNSWLSTNRATVKVNSTEQSGDDETDPTTYEEYVFTVSAPTTWSAVTFGYPDIIPSGTPLPGDPATNPSQLNVPGSSSSSKPASTSPSDVTLAVAAIAVLGLGLGLAWHARSRRKARAA